MAAWATASGMTGLTLPGMIDEPAWRAGRRISPSPACGPGGQQPQIVGDLQQVGGQRAEDAADLDEDVGVLRGIDEVFGPGQSQAGDLPQVLDDAEDVLPRRAEARADGRAAEVHHAQPLLALVDPPAIAGEWPRHRPTFRGPASSSTASCNSVRPILTTSANCFSFCWNASSSATTLRCQLAQAEDGRHSQGRGIGVVGRLVQVDVVVRIDALGNRPAAGRAIAGPDWPAPR